MTSVADRVRGSARPVLIAGGGAIRPGIGDELVALAEAESIPIVTTLAGKGTIPDAHRLAGGIFGTWGCPLANALVAEADLVIAVATKLATSDTAEEDPRLLDPRRQEIVQIDIEPRNAGWTFPVAEAVISEARVALAELRRMLGDAPSDGATVAARAAWLQHAVGQDPKLMPCASSGDVPIHPQRLIHELRTALPDDAIVCVDAGEVRLLMGRYFETRAAGRYLQPSGLGGMAYGIPAALGARVVHRDRPLVAVCGDGGFSLTLAGLLSAVEEELPIAVVIFNNRALGWVLHGQRERGEQTFKSDLNDFDYASIARAIGCHAERVEEPDQLAGALERALSAGRPAVLDVVVSTAETHVELRSPLLSPPKRASR
jgi:acetolactate synthase-1/2/3 large subunit